MPIQVIYETDHIFLLRDSTMSNALIFLLFFCNLKEKVHIGRITNSKKNYLCVK